MRRIYYSEPNGTYHYDKGGGRQDTVIIGLRDLRLLLSVARGASRVSGPYFPEKLRKAVSRMNKPTPPPKDGKP